MWLGVQGAHLFDFKFPGHNSHLQPGQKSIKFLLGPCLPEVLTADAADADADALALPDRFIGCEWQKEAQLSEAPSPSIPPCCARLFCPTAPAVVITRKELKRRT